MKKIVGIFINAEQKGFLLSLASILEKKYDITTRLICRDMGVKKLVDNTFTDRSKSQDIVLSNLEFEVSNIISESLAIESKYKSTLSLLISQDRGLGQGYLFNVENIPNIIRASWPHKKKLKEFIKVINKYESAIEGCDFVIRTWPDKITSMICEDKGISSYSFVPMKFGSRMFWSNDNYVTSSKYFSRVTNNLSNMKSTKILNYEIDFVADNINKSASYSFLHFLKESFNLIWNENKVWLRGRQQKNSYNYLAWLPSIFRRMKNYNYLKSISVKPSQISDYRLCFFPLHLEPEIALLNYSPEFNNSMEIISWISKSLPADVLIVIKEHPLGFGVRSSWYYRQLNKIGNVVWADPSIHSWDWIKKSNATSTITGTVGVEAVYMEKPVISFGAHQIINELPSVFYSNSYTETKNAIDEIFVKNIDLSILKKSNAALQDAQIKSSFEYPRADYESLYISDNLDEKNASKALNHLFLEYPQLLKYNI